MLAWLRVPALDEALARDEPKILHAVAWLTRGGLQGRLKIQASWPWAADIATAWQTH